jgi:hypothetical protein
MWWDEEIEEWRSDILGYAPTLDAAEAAAEAAGADTVRLRQLNYECSSWRAQGGHRDLHVGEWTSYD